MANLQRLLDRAKVAYDKGQLAETEQLCRQVLAAKPKVFDAVHLLALAQTQSRQYDKALASYDRALAIQPARSGTWSNRGLVLHEMGRHDEALASYDRALKVSPKNANAQFNRGNTLYVLGRLEEALQAYDRALEGDSQNPKILCNRGAALFALRRFEAAIESCDQALARQPRNVEAHINRAVALHELKRYDEAIASCDAALSLSPNQPEALRGRGNALYSLGRADDALTHLDRAIALNPNHVEAHYGRGIVLIKLGRLEDALSSFDRAIVLHPAHAKAIHGRGDALYKLKHYDRAFAAFDKAYALDRDLMGLEGARLGAKLHACDWANFDTECTHLIASIADGKANSTPFTFLTIPSFPADQLQCAKLWVTSSSPTKPPVVGTGETYRHDRIRLAYLSGDFRDHPVAQALSGLLEHHDRSRFEIIGLSTGLDDASSLRGRIVKSLDCFYDVRTTSDAEAARLIRELEVDILVAVAPHTEDSRLGIVAHRAAPIQVSGLSAWTSGTDFIDYILADPRALPFTEQQFYTEQIVHLPDSYFPHDDKQPIAETTGTRTDHGLPEDGFVFCSFNRSYKLNPLMFETWMRLLKNIEGSVLWLAQPHPHAIANLRREAEARGIDSSRLIFAPKMPSLDQHLARHRLADLFLDTLPYGAHTTSKDALWAGLPVLTCRGDTFVGRIAASQLHAVGLPGLVTNTPAEYEAAALRLAGNPDELRGMRTKLAANRTNHPLFDTLRLCRHFEAAYTAMYERHQAGLPPAQLSV